MEVVNINDLQDGDSILVPGTGPDETCIVEILTIVEGLILFKESEELDYEPQDPNCIIRINKAGEKTAVIVLSNSIRLGLSSKWRKRFAKLID